MSQATESIAKLKEHPVLSIVAVLSLIGGGGSLFTFANIVRTYDNIADKPWVTEQIAIHARMADSRLDSIEDGQDRIRAFVEIVPELKSLLTLQCMGTPNLDATIARLEREYKELTGEDYDEPGCERLMARAL